MRMLLAAAVMMMCAGCCCPAWKASELPVTVPATIETSMGTIVLELDRGRAPVSVENFIAFAEDGAYDGTVIHRVVPGFVIQGGGHTADLTELGTNDSPIVNEWQNGLKNQRGTIGMARETEPDSATRQWYINLANNDRLDIGRDVSGNAGYAVFGRVVSGMDVVDAIAGVETHDPDGSELKNVPIEPVTVLSVSIAREAPSDG